MANANFLKATKTITRSLKNKIKHHCGAALSVTFFGQFHAKMCWDLLLFRVCSAVSFFSAVFIDGICIIVQVLVLCCVWVEFLQLTLHRVSVIQLCVEFMWRSFHWVYSHGGLFDLFSSCYLENRCLNFVWKKWCWTPVRNKMMFEKDLDHLCCWCTCMTAVRVNDSCWYVWQLLVCMTAVGVNDSCWYVWQLLVWQLFVCMTTVGVYGSKCEHIHRQLHTSPHQAFFVFKTFIDHIKAGGNILRNKWQHFLSKQIQMWKFTTDQKKHKMYTQQ